MTALHQHLTRRPYVRLVGDSDRRNAALRNRLLPSVVSERAGDGTDVSNLEPRRAEEGLCVFIRPLVSSSGPNFWDWTHAGAVVDSAFGRGVPLGCETGDVTSGPRRSMRSPKGTPTNQDAETPARQGIRIHGQSLTITRAVPVGRCARHQGAQV